MRLQLALNVPDLEASIDFHTRLFGEPPAKVKPGYANWSLDSPPLKFVLFEDPDAEPGSVNHLGVEVVDADTVVTEEARLREAGLATTGIDDTVCCFAEKVETWVTSPESTRWEVYVKQADVDEPEAAPADEATGTCCTPAASADELATCCA